LDLREELEKLGHPFMSTCDTEVLLAAIEQWGVIHAVKKFNGMFAFAVFDRRERELWLVRDRLGEKPLFYGWNEGSFLFASELKSLFSYEHFSPELCPEAITGFSGYGYVPAPYSIYRNIFKLIPGTTLCLDLDTLLRKPNDFSPGTADIGTKRAKQPQRYWDIVAVAGAAARSRIQLSNQEVITQTEELLHKAIQRRMAADVPLGAFLSGGVDSTTVTALLQSLSNRPIKTFSIGYAEPQYDESIFAKRASFHIGTEHTQFIVTPKDALELIPKLPFIYDEPFADASQVPSTILCLLAKPHVTVALSGDGGDELFGGYVRHHLAERIARSHRIGFGVPGLLARWVIERLSPQRWDEIYPKLRALVPGLPSMRTPGHYAYKFASVLGTKDPMEIYARLTRLWDREVVVNPALPDYRYNSAWNSTWKPTPTENMMMLDLLTYLPDDIFVKVDRASMSTALEVRAPFLDHPLVEFCWGLDIKHKVVPGDSKHILKAIAQKYVPREIYDRPKTGFGIPIDSWLRGPLKEWVEDLISERSLEMDGIFQAKLVRQKWQEHLSGRRNWQYHLWYILMFQAWRRRDFRERDDDKQIISPVVIN
jgi:asparagine synthase (glutamine-hydrolysing)